MRRAQSVRNQTRPSAAFGINVDDLGVLREAEESPEVALRRQLLEKDRENDKLRAQIQALQVQLAERPPLETIQALDREYKNLELILQGTQRENERCMADMERGKAREKMLERELVKLAGENWQTALDISPNPNISVGNIPRSILHQRSATMGSPIVTTPQETDNTLLSNHVQQIRMLIMGMEERLTTREEKLQKEIQKAESESQRFEELQHQVLVDA